MSYSVILQYNLVIHTERLSSRFIHVVLEFRICVHVNVNYIYVPKMEVICTSYLGPRTGCGKVIQNAS